MNKIADFIHCLCCLAEHGCKQRKAVEQAVPNMQVNLDAGFLCLFGESYGIIQQRFRIPCLYHQRRQTL